jgi:Amino acid permease
VKTLVRGGHPHAVVVPPGLPAATVPVSLWLLMRAFASGCTAMTGVEAVSNGVTVFAEPAARRAQHTLTAIVAILGLLLAGIASLCHAYGIGATDPLKAGYQSVISQVVGAVVGRGFLYYTTLGSTLAVLALSANTSFAGFPRLCHLIADDDYLPHAFAHRGRRLVYSSGIVILAVFAGAILIAFGGITDRLIPLFAVGAFLAFTLSQAGMVAHWKREGGRGARTSLLVNGVGAVSTGGALAVVLIAKFVEGAWIIVLLIPAILYLFHRVKRHYDHVRREIASPRPLDVSHLQPPVVALPITGWNRITEKALRFALRVSPDVEVIHIGTDDESAAALRKQWQQYVEQPLHRERLPLPHLMFLPSPRRHLVTPLIRCLEGLEKEYPGRPIAVIIPELVQNRWYQHLLHNHTAAVLKAALLFHGDRRMVVINVPWYLGEEDHESSSGIERPAGKAAA